MMMRFDVKLTDGGNVDTDMSDRDVGKTTSR
jgi:hypothetical protein